MDLARVAKAQQNDEAGPDVLNNAGAWAALTSGIGFSQFENMLGTLGFPAMIHNTFSKNESFVEKVWLEHLEKSISKAGKEERLLAEEKGDVDSDGVPLTTGEIEDSRENPPPCGIIPARFPRAKTEVTPPRIEPGSPWWEVSGLVTRLHRPPKSSIHSLTAAARGAIQHCGCAGEQVSELVRDLETGPYHVFGQHERCRSDFYNNKEAEEKGQTQKKILNKKIERQNARKRSRLSYDDADRPAKRYKVSATPDTDYGPEAEQQDQLELTRKSKEFVTTLQVSVDERDKIAKEACGQADGELWHDMRRSRLTASNFGAVCRQDTTSCADLVFKMVAIHP
ncbi:hypothetical protein PR048_028253 [Dryococelus australis]|uniref:Mutator-like transposase domain-containing protein n=1 Tax=Dryococelus australis TaxID=614101 RepID=A0ABQ9GIR9_9NEOP|nr:hypothetical protein PR048_028253 [Dryococelus australis]